MLATETGNSATSPDNSTTIGKTATETVDAPPTQCTPSSATATGDQKQSKRQSESQLQGDLNRQKTYEFEIEKLPNSPVTTCQQKSPDTEIIETQQGGPTHNTTYQSSRVRQPENDSLPAHWMRYSRRTPKEQGNLMASTKSQIQRPHPRETVRTLVAGALRSSRRQLRKRRCNRRNCRPPLHWASVQTTHGLQTRAGTPDEVHRQKSPHPVGKKAVVLRLSHSGYCSVPEGSLDLF
jgi:hypothetical protein